MLNDAPVLVYRSTVFIDISADCFVELNVVVNSFSLQDGIQVDQELAKDHVVIVFDHHSPFSGIIPFSVIRYSSYSSGIPISYFSK